MSLRHSWTWIAISRLPADSLREVWEAATPHSHHAAPAHTQTHLPPGLWWLHYTIPPAGYSESPDHLPAAAQAGDTGSWIKVQRQYRVVVSRDGELIPSTPPVNHLARAQTHTLPGGQWVDWLPHPGRMLIKLTPAVTQSLPQDMSVPLERERNAEQEVMDGVPEKLHHFKDKLFELLSSIRHVQPTTANQHRVLWRSEEAAGQTLHCHTFTSSDERAETSDEVELSFFWVERSDHRFLKGKSQSVTDELKM